jgi:hypothetical protein
MSGTLVHEASSSLIRTLKGDSGDNKELRTSLFMVIDFSNGTRDSHSLSDTLVSCKNKNFSLPVWHTSTFVIDNAC